MCQIRLHWYLVNLVLSSPDKGIGNLASTLPKDFNQDSTQNQHALDLDWNINDDHGYKKKNESELETTIRCNRIIKTKKKENKRENWLTIIFLLSVIEGHTLEQDYLFTKECKGKPPDNLFVYPRYRKAERRNWINQELQSVVDIW